MGGNNFSTDENWKGDPYIRDCSGLRKIDLITVGYKFMFNFYCVSKPEFVSLTRLITEKINLFYFYRFNRSRTIKG